jgi:hypothetical protein
MALYFAKDMKFAGGSGCGEVLWLLSYGEEVEGRTSFLGRNVVCVCVCVCVCARACACEREREREREIAYELTRFRVLVILSPYLSTAYEQIRALQTRVVTEQNV